MLDDRMWFEEKTKVLKKIYRICDNRDGKTLIDGVTKKDCFSNFIKVFGTTDLTVVADNTHQDTVDFIRAFTSDIKITSLGNSKSFMYALDLAISNNQGSETVYLVEDDYLHLANAEKIILEGIQKADYVSLYDHPDKYMSPGPNPFIQDGGEVTKVILTQSTHWKYTNSTTMTFAAQVHTLKEDYEILKRHCATERPLDFQMFCELGRRNKKIITPVPGRSTHCDHFPSPFIFQQP